MNERLRMIGAKLTILSQIKRTEISFSLPIDVE
jgi:signal transduction histidine kinase